MDQLQRVIQRASFRMAVGRFVRALLLTITGATGAIACTLIAQRLFGLPINWNIAAIIAGAAALVAALAWAWFTRPDRLAVARVVDERAGLREAISTALFLEGHDDPWSRATVDQAAAASQRVMVRQVFPARTPSVWPAPMVAAAVLGLLMLAVPQIDLLGLMKKADAETKAKVDLEQAKIEVKTQNDDLQKALAKIDDADLNKEAADAAELPEAKTAEEVRLSAIKKLTSIQDKLSELRGGEKGMQLDALTDKLSQLKQPGPGPLNDAVQALQAGDFKKANEALAKLADKIAEGKLSEADKAALKEQMQKLADQLNKLAQDKKALESKLSEMGLDSKLASDPSALQAALDKMDNLTDAQKQQMMQAAKAADKASKACQNMASAMAKAGQKMQAGEGQAMKGMENELSELEMMAQEMDAADAARAAVQGNLMKLGGQCDGNGQGQAKFDMWQLYSKEGKSRGQGDGSMRSSKEAPFDTKKEMSIGPTQAGPKIGTTFVQGDQVRGESTAEFTEAVEAGSQAATEAIDHNAIPREYQDAVKRYFGRLEKKVKTEQAAPAPAAAPAGAAPAPAPAAAPAPAPVSGGEKKSETPKPAK